MATANTALRVTELDFDSIKRNLKTYLRSQSEFQDFDFDGSGMSVLLDILAYNTHYMGYYINMIANEMFLDTAQLRASVLSHAKMIGYVPRSAEGALTLVDINVTPSNAEDQTLNLLTVDKYTRFIGQDIDGNNYNFVTLYTNTSPKVAGSFTFSNVTIKQGEVRSYQYVMDSSNTKRRFNIPAANVDTRTLTVSVQESASNTDITPYTMADDITALTGSSKVYFLEENSDSTYTLYFGDNIIGARPKNGSIINCQFLNTVGSVSNNISRFTIAQPIGPFNDNVSISATRSTYGGIDKESVEQIRFNAPNFYTAQNRAVTALDYATLLQRDYANIESVKVWGGDENDPPVYGKVYVCIKTREDYELSNLEKETIKETLIKQRNVMTVTPEIVDPDFTFLLMRGTITYDPKKTTLKSTQLLPFVRAAILDYESRELNRFDSTFRKSKLQSYIENSEKSITGSDITIYLQKRITLEPNLVQRYVISTNFPIKKNDLNNRINSFPAIRTYDGNNVEREVLFEEVPSSATGIASIDVVNPGIGYLTPPTIRITGDGTGARATATIVSGRITKINLVSKGENYTRATVEISGGGGREASAVIKLQSKLGNLRTYYTRSGGTKIIVNPNVGTVDYETGQIVINPFTILGTAENDTYVENVLTLNMPISSEIIPPLRNRIITIDQNDPRSVQFEVSADS